MNINLAHIEADIDTVHVPACTAAPADRWHVLLQIRELDRKHWPGLVYTPRLRLKQVDEERRLFDNSRTLMYLPPPAQENPRLDGYQLLWSADEADAFQRRVAAALTAWNEAPCLWLAGAHGDETCHIRYPEVSVDMKVRQETNGYLVWGRINRMEKHTPEVPLHTAHGLVTEADAPGKPWCDHPTGTVHLRWPSWKHYRDSRARLAEYQPWSIVYKGLDAYGRAERLMYTMASLICCWAAYPSIKRKGT